MKDKINIKNINSDEIKFEIIDKFNEKNIVVDLDTQNIKENNLNPNNSNDPNQTMPAN